MKSFVNGRCYSANLMIHAALFPVLFILSCLAVSCRQQIKTANPVIKAKAPKTSGDEDPELQFPSLNKKVVLKRLYDEPVIDAGGTAIWKPNFYERLTYDVSYDGKCHTSVDTIMYFKDNPKRTCAVVILATYKYRRSEVDSTKIDTGDCHFCGVPLGVALFAQDTLGKWNLYAFEKHFTSLGYFGAYRTGLPSGGHISLEKIGANRTCLSLVQGPGGNGGYLNGYEALYTVEQYHINGFPEDSFSKILTYDNYYEIPDEHGKLKTQAETTMKIMPMKGDYYDIDLVSITNGKKSIDHLKYSEEEDRYITK